MIDASSVVLSGFKLRAEAQIIKWPNRYEDKDSSSKLMWTAAMKILENGGAGVECVARPKSQIETDQVSN
jgi:hypothetical protein